MDEALVVQRQKSPTRKIRDGLGLAVGTETHLTDSSNLAPGFHSAGVPVLRIFPQGMAMPSVTFTLYSCLSLRKVNTAFELRGRVKISVSLPSSF